MREFSYHFSSSLTYLLRRVRLHLRLRERLRGPLAGRLRLLGRLGLGLLLLQALTVHGDAAVAVELLALGRRRLVGRSGAVVGRLLVLLAAVPPVRMKQPAEMEMETASD